MNASPDTHRPSTVTVQVGNGTGNCGRDLSCHCGWGFRPNCGIHGTVRQIVATR